MNYQYFLIREDVLPYVVSKVLRVKESLKDNPSLTVQEAVKLHDCSRSAFYKYRDTIFPLDEVNNASKEFTIILFVTDKVGTLATILDKISQLHLSVLTIHQSVPIDKKASITLSLNARKTDLNVYDIINTLRQLDNVHNVDIIGMNM
ncbi:MULTISPECIES: ACT domain-containing protein [Staphylococcus]|uniref:ACT domain-containing protein n=1 Tax=Staphylococcus agnetis TaxID=985762 RepID=A0A2T4MJD4_9STAP|nr:MULTISPECIES: ACT domain-containing protein [Staphylococcus]NHM93139.1 ACT domain-containing protein [Staphylococcus sp. 10602379]NJI03441.1 ACT domain-containing protein [Staphylococcus agnetis]NJI14188.1 ACT domain-containing protein [Staphylococcus agnetis]PTH15127.1 ACT domain-containing protein [Staphylococcus agnetis]PTH29562.1 ACT domain-containing protein [Staphylococcus agnetis]